MPCINGACVPPICPTYIFDTTKAFVEGDDGKKKVNLTAMGLGFGAAELAAYVAKLAKPVDFPCDGCKCFHAKKNPNPWQALPDEAIAAITVGPITYKAYITGGLYKVDMGVCVPPGGSIRFHGEVWQKNE